MKLIAFSKEDIAGNNIVNILLEQYKFDEREDVKLVGFEKSFLFRESFDEFKPELCIVASRHRSESGKPTLTCHVTGNFGNADFGGEPKTLAIAPALYLKQALLALKRNGKDIPYEISLEVTHHGPTQLPFPVLFVEVGSSLEQWNDQSACYAMASTINGLVENKPDVVPVAIGFGGPHYAPNFSQVVEKVALGHIMPKYAAGNINKEMIKQMIEKTLPIPDFALFDWKGLKGDERRGIIDILDEMGMNWKKTSEFKN